MKRIILCFVLVLCASGIINAQTNGGTLRSSSSDTTKFSSKDQTGKKNEKPNERSQLDNREIYNWKNGQQATPTGNEATGTNSGYSAMRRDSTRKDKNK